ncbi:cytochrome c oxidase subunit VIb [Meredithblackwellia eburnea MCA 4105]
MSEGILKTVGFDARFPNTNQSKHCFVNYVDYFRCVDAKGEEATICQEFKRNYQSLCPNEWIGKWDDQRENGNFPAKLTAN